MPEYPAALCAGCGRQTDYSVIGEAGCGLCADCNRKIAGKKQSYQPKKKPDYPVRHGGGGGMNREWPLV